MYPPITRAELEKALGSKKPKLRHVDLSAIDIRKPPIDFTGVTLESCTLSNLVFDGMTLEKATLKNCWVDGISLAKTNLAGATITGGLVETDMRKANLRGARLKRFEFSSCDLRGADLSNADVSSASFIDCDLRGTIFTRANVAGADFDGAKTEGAIGLEADPKRDEDLYETIAPEGGPVVFLPASLEKKWKADVEGEDETKVSGWVGTSSVALGKARALLLDGELDTGFVPTEAGGVLVRGGDFDDDLDTARKAALKALAKKKGWKDHAHRFVVLDGAGAKLIDANGAETAIACALAKGRYAVSVLGTNSAGGPVVFVRLKILTGA